MSIHNPGVVPRLHFTFDADLELHDGAAATTAAQNGQVDGAARVIDVGTGRVFGNLVIDIQAIKTSVGDEKYRLLLQGAVTDPAFGSELGNMVIVELGHNSVIDEDATTTAGTRIVVPFTNAIGDRLYSQVRFRVVPSGTAPSITYTARLAKAVH